MVFMRSALPWQSTQDELDAKAWVPPKTASKARRDKRRLFIEGYLLFYETPRSLPPEARCLGRAHPAQASADGGMKPGIKGSIGGDHNYVKAYIYKKDYWGMKKCLTARLLGG